MSWDYKTLGDVAEIFSGYAFKSADMNAIEGIPLIKIKNIFGSNVSQQCDTFLNKDFALAKFKKVHLQRDDFLVAMTGQGSVGRIGKMRNYAPGYYVNQRVAIVRVNSSLVNPEFVFYQIATASNEIELFKKANGAGQPNISAKQIGELPVRIPAENKQDAIVNILSAYDDLIENNQKQIKLLEEAAQRLYKEWFVDLRFPGHEDVAIIDGVPAGWKQEKLFEIANVIMGQSPKSEFYNTDKDGLPFHQGVGNYGRRFVKDDVYSTSYTRVAEENSILFSVRAPVGRLNITKNEIVIGRGLAAITHKLGYQSYLFYMLKERFFKDNLVGNGAIFASITKDELLNQMFINPDEELVRKFNETAKNIDDKIKALDSQTELLKQARDRLLPKLMSGEIEV